jgi:hypothetical protein
LQTADIALVQFVLCGKLGFGLLKYEPFVVFSEYIAPKGTYLFKVIVPERQEYNFFINFNIHPLKYKTYSAKLCILVLYVLHSILQEQGSIWKSKHSRRIGLILMLSGTTASASRRHTM